MSKEWEIGKHRAVLDDVNKVLIVNVNGDFNVKEVEDYIQVSKEAFPGITSGRRMMIKFSKTLRGSMMTKEARESLKKTFQEAEETGGDRIAIVSSSPAIRMVFKVFSKTLGLANNKFFKSEDDAMAWLKEE